MLFAFLLASAVAQSNSLPAAPVPMPIISTAVSPPPVIVPMPPRPPSRFTAPPVVVDVKVMAGDRTLFDDALRVDPINGASYTQTRSEASALNCPSSLYETRSASHNFHVRLSQRSFGEKNQAIAVDVSWTRPGAAQSCDNSGSRLATLSQLVKLSPGKPVRIDGDAGLRVEVRQR